MGLGHGLVGSLHFVQDEKMMKTSRDPLTMELLPVAVRGATGLCGPFPRGKEGATPKHTEVGVAGSVRLSL